MKPPIYFIMAILLFTTAMKAQDLVVPPKENVPEEKINTNAVKSKENVEVNTSVTKETSEVGFYKNAKLAGLSEEKTNELIKTIEERNKVLKILDTKKKQADAPFSVQDPGTLYNFKINQARNYYAKKISGLITYKQYGYFVVDNYREEAKENSESEYIQLVKSNSSLTKEQKLKLYKLIYSYHLNQLLTTAYFSFDKTLQKPKLGVLRFNFEKDFAKTCQEYNIKTAEPTGTSTNSFQWN